MSGGKAPNIGNDDDVCDDDDDQQNTYIKHVSVCLCASCIPESLKVELKSQKDYVL